LTVFVVALDLYKVELNHIYFAGVVVNDTFVLEFIHSSESSASSSPTLLFVLV